MPVAQPLCALPTPRAVIYARVSTDRQRGNYSIATQVERARAYVEARGYGLTGDRYVDPVTGRDVLPSPGSVAAYADDCSSFRLSRPALDAALEFLRTTGAEVFVVYSLDRLAYDPAVRQTLEHIIARLGARVEYVQTSVNGEAGGPDELEAEAAHVYSEHLRRLERSQRGKLAKAERGLFVAGRPPYGYRLQRDAPGGLAVVEGEARVVRHIFDLYVGRGASIREIARHLTQAGIATPRWRGRWGRSSVARILDNESYAGRSYYNRSVRAEQQRRLRSRAEWIGIAVPAIIPRAVLEAAQQRRREDHAEATRWARRSYLLGGRVVCAHCGRPFGTQTKKAGRDRRRHDAPAYRHRASHGHCRNQMISARRLEAAVWTEMAAALEDAEALVENYSAAWREADPSALSHRQHLQTLHAELWEASQRRNRLGPALLDAEGESDRGQLRARLARLDKSIAALRLQIAAAYEDLESRRPAAEVEELRALAARLQNLAARRRDPPWELKRELLERLEVRVLVGQTGRFRVEGRHRGSQPFSGLASGDSRQTGQRRACDRPLAGSVDCVGFCRVSRRAEPAYGTPSTSQAPCRGCQTESISAFSTPER